MLPATIVEMNKFPKIQFLILSYFYPIMLSKADDNSLWIVLFKTFTAPWFWEWHNYP